jgi:small GTP-binding protein
MNNTNDSVEIFKVVFLGASTVGKTCLVNRICRNEFNQWENSTIGCAFHNYKLPYNEFLQITQGEYRCRTHLEGVRLHLWDTAGQERYHCLSKLYYRGAHAIIVVYDLNDIETSLAHAERWIHEVKTMIAPMPLIYLIGNKLDLVQVGTNNNSLKQRIDNLLKTHMITRHYTTSAKTGENISGIIPDICKDLLQTTTKKDPHPYPYPNYGLPKPHENNSMTSCCIIS